MRKRIEEAFGWSKDGRPMRKMRVRGLSQRGFMTILTIGCHSLLRVAKLCPIRHPRRRRVDAIRRIDPGELEGLVQRGCKARGPPPDLSKMNRSITTTFIDQRFSTAC